ncbi:hypothetical protein [Sphingopyxis sp. LC363]|uniref:hypothetical protein n=1 Tax=Sphingopyxis sp. LC363 TaxID=1120705 RepID=UPI00056872D1|nr:hypothetical protein [Sphingopyxis sp. LC363]
MSIDALVWMMGACEPLILAIVGKAYPERPPAHDRAHRHLGFQLHRAYGVSRLPVRGLVNQLPIGRERRFDMRA